MTRPIAPTRREFLTSLALGVGLSGRLGVAAPGSPLAVYPELERRLRGEADRRPTVLRRGIPARLDGGAAVLAPDVGQPALAATPGAPPELPPDALATFALDVPDDAYVTGEIELTPDRDLRPGLRATVLADARVIATPMVGMAGNHTWGIDEIIDPAPAVVGAAPPSRIPIGEFLLPAGRHYLTVAAPHFRGGGRLVAVMLEATARAVETPRYRFALIGDTHVRFDGREDWMNRKMGVDMAPELARTLRDLAAEGIDFVMHGGDMTERALREEFALLAGLLKAQPLPVYGCIGNHDRYLVTSRPDARELLADHFPGGELEYVVSRPPLRFVVLDVEIEEPVMQPHKRRWLRETLAADTITPTIVVWHYAPFNRGGVSSCGFRMHDWSALGRETVLDIVRSAPNVVATLNGHDHWDEINRLDGITHVQNAALVEWPNSYRVFRVYDDRLEWEVRQVANRGFVRESFIPRKAVSWMIATRESDLTGSVSLARR